MYTIPQSQQLLNFLYSLGIGFLLGILYDLIRCIRLALTKSKVAIVFFDILYFILFSFCSYIFILACNKGEVRLYIITGEIIGAAFYYFSFGVAVIRITDIIVRFIKKFFHSLFIVITYPFKLLHKLFLKISKKSRHLLKINAKFYEKKQKKVLPKLRLYVYNLFGILCARKDSLKKGGKGFGNKEKEKTEQNL